MPTRTSPIPRAMARPGSLTVLAMAESALSACRTAGMLVLLIMLTGSEASRPAPRRRDGRPSSQV
jgi:hypothetical protein